MQQWGVNSASDLEYKQGSTQKQRACTVIVHFYATITEGNRTHIVQLYKKEECWGWDKAAKQNALHLSIFCSAAQNEQKDARRLRHHF